MLDYAQGFIPLWRSEFDERIFKDAELWKIWTWCRMKAGHTGRWVYVTTGRSETEVFIERGSLIVGRNKTSEELKIKPGNFRNKLKKLEKYKKITIHVHSHYSVVSIINYDDYVNSKTKCSQPNQSKTFENSNHLTTNQQKVDTNNNYNNYNIIKNSENLLTSCGKLNNIKEEKRYLFSVFTERGYPIELLINQYRKKLVEKKSLTVLSDEIIVKSCKLYLKNADKHSIVKFWPYMTSLIDYNLTLSIVNKQIFSEKTTLREKSNLQHISEIMMQCGVSNESGKSQIPNI